MDTYIVGSLVFGCLVLLCGIEMYDETQLCELSVVIRHNQSTGKRWQVSEGPTGDCSPLFSLREDQVPGHLPSALPLVRRHLAARSTSVGGREAVRWPD